MQHPFMGPGPTRSSQIYNYRTGGSFERNRLNSDWWGQNIFSKVFEGFDGFDPLTEEFGDGTLGFEMLGAIGRRVDPVLPSDIVGAFQDSVLLTQEPDESYEAYKTRADGVFRVFNRVVGQALAPLIAALLYLRGLLPAMLTVILAVLVSRDSLFLEAFNRWSLGRSHESGWLCCKPG